MWLLTAKSLKIEISASHPVGPASGTVINAQDLYHAGLNAVGNDIGCICDHQFPCSSDTAGASDMRVVRQVGFDRINNCHRQLLRGNRVVGRNICLEVAQIIKRFFRPLDDHDLRERGVLPSADELPQVATHALTSA